MSVTEGVDGAKPVTVGVDWASDSHAVCVIDADGEPVQRFTVSHTRAGLRQLVAILGRYRVGGVGIERPDGPVVDALLDAQLPVFVIPPSQLKALRQRYGSAGNKDDQFDAYVLADTVRTDRRRLTALQRDDDVTVALRGRVRWSVYKILDEGVHRCPWFKISGSRMGRLVMRLMT